MALLFIFLSQTIHQFEGIFIKKYNSKYNYGGFIFTAIVSLFSMIFFIIYDVIADVNGLEFNYKLILYGISAGIMFSLASLLTFIAMGCGSYVLSKLILSYGIVFTIGYGIYLGDSITVLGWIAIVLIIISLFLVKGNEEENTKVNLKWIITISLSVLFAGVFAILQKKQQIVFEKKYDNEFMIITLGSSFIILLTIGLIKDRKHIIDILKHGSLYAAAGGISNGVTNLLTLYLYSIAPLSFVSPVGAGVSIVISFIISKILFKEKFSKLQILGVLIGMISIVLFNL